jgi:hypothetical protein
MIVRETSYKPASRGGKGMCVLKRGRLTKFEWPLEVLVPPEGDEEVPTSGNVGDEGEP